MQDNKQEGASPEREAMHLGWIASDGQFISKHEYLFLPTSQQMQCSACYSPPHSSRTEAETARKIESITEQELADFIFHQGMFGSPEYWHAPSVQITDTEEGEVYFKFTQHQKGGLDGKVIETSGSISLGNNPVLYIEKFGSSFFSLKNTNAILEMGFYLPISLPAPPPSPITVENEEQQKSEETEAEKFAFWVGWMFMREGQLWKLQASNDPTRWTTQQLYRTWKGTAKIPPSLSV